MAHQTRELGTQGYLDPAPSSGGHRAQESHPRSSLPSLGSATVHQAHLESSLDDPNPPFGPHTRVDSIEGGDFDPKGREFTLQPQDEGFGAWSYVAAAFAMYIVVWGWYFVSLQIATALLTSS